MARKPMVRHAHHERLGFPVVLNQSKDLVHSQTVAKVEFEGALYHVIVRDNHRRDIFRDESNRVA
jgi:hypothetical protein